MKKIKVVLFNIFIIYLIERYKIKIKKTGTYITTHLLYPHCHCNDSR